MVTQTNDTKRYQKMDQISHILKRPDMYCGSIRMRQLSEYTARQKTDSGYEIIKSDITMSPAILRIFVEPLSNAIDNVERSKKTNTPCTKIKVYINKDTGETSVWNDGDVVPIEFDKDENCYNHTMIFGQLLTGSNYNDEEERIVSGRNGIGVKLCNIFSTYFKVQGCDPVNNKSFSQEWSNNMRQVEEPVVKQSKTKGFTHITWIPDFKRFGLKSGYTHEIIDLYVRYVIDAAMLSNVKVYLNDTLVKTKTLADYSHLYSPSHKDKLFINTNDHKVVLTPSDEFQSISFVNGVYTRLGGQHVDAWSEAIFRPLIDKFNKASMKRKGPKLNIADVKQFFRLFVVSTIVRPEFDGQDKNKLESPNVSVKVKPSHISSVLKWDVIDKIEDLLKSKEMIVLKNAEKAGKKTKIDGLDPANKAGSKYSKDCSLFVCEGLSAKTYVVAGIEKGVYDKKGRDWFGILPVTGKVLNVMNSTPTSIANNKVICKLIHALGLKHGVDYTNDNFFEKLNYGRIILIADADVDGIHIEGLLINFIHTLYPSLLQRSEPFIVSMKTPIARVIMNKKKGDLLFYDETRFKSYIQSPAHTSKNVKYYKGLGTTKPSDVPDTFGLKMVEYIYDTHTSTCMKKAFGNKHADDRKVWISNYDNTRSPMSLDDTGVTSNMKISEFIDNELIKFSFADCARSLPNSIDGLKESQRKLLFAVKKRKLKFKGKSLKVAQLAGYTAEHSNYHHGEKNLFDTIIGMANEFPGTNNIPLLYRDGMFGTRLEGANDAADGRYIFTKMDALTELIYREEDEPLLTSVVDDGDKVQPEHYIPILPMSLVNGCTAGIGTGWSCCLPCYNPLVIIKRIHQWIDKHINHLSPVHDELIPWYRGFKGDIEKCSDNKYITYGIAMEGKNKTVHVNELPIGMWTNKFKDFVEDLKMDKKIKHVKNYSSPTQVHFIIQEEDAFNCDLNTLKLHSYLYTSNIVMFNELNKLIKYASVDELLDNFCKVRYTFYTKRREYQIKRMNELLKHLLNKERFIMDVINGHIQIMNRHESSIIDALKKRNYEEEDTGYDYLLKLHIRTLTVGKVNELRNEIAINKMKLDVIKSTSEVETWTQELAQFENEYLKWKDTV